MPLFATANKDDITCCSKLWGAVCADDKLKMAPIKLALFRTALPFLANKHLYLVNSRLDLVNPNFDLLNPRIDLVNTSSDLVNQRVDLVYTIYILYVGGALPRNRSRTGTIVVL